MVELIVSPEYLAGGERVLIIDDFLASGATIMGLVRLAQTAGADGGRHRHADREEPSRAGAACWSRSACRSSRWRSSARWTTGRSSSRAIGGHVPPLPPATPPLSLPDLHLDVGTPALRPAGESSCAKPTSCWLSGTRIPPTLPCHPAAPPVGCAAWTNSTLPIPSWPRLDCGDAQSLVQEYDLGAYRLIVNGGEYQDFPHLHFHLISDLPAARPSRKRQLIPGMTYA